MLRTRFLNTVAKRSLSGAPLAADVQYTAADALKKVILAIVFNFYLCFKVNLV